MILNKGIKKIVTVANKGLLSDITGGLRLYGKVYVGAHGRGILYGDPVDVHK